MAISSFGVTLKWGESAETVAKVVDIKDFGDLIGEPNMLETTTLSDAQTTRIPGLRSGDSIPFNCNYTSADYQKCKTDEGKPLYYELSFSDGSSFAWQGQHTLSVPGKGVDEVLEFTVNVAASTSVEFKAAG
jgi:hypothetical protein